MHAHTHSFILPVSYTHTHTHTLDQCSQAPYWAFLSLLGLVSEGSQAPTEIFTHFLVQSLFCPLAAIFHSLTADELCFLSHQLKITLIWKWLTQAEMAIMLHRWRRSPYSHHRSKHEAYILPDRGHFLESYCIYPVWSRGPPGGHKSSRDTFNINKEGIFGGLFKKEEKRVHMCVCVCASLCMCWRKLLSVMMPWKFVCVCVFVCVLSGRGCNI